MKDCCFHATRLVLLSGLWGDMGTLDETIAVAAMVLQSELHSFHQRRRTLDITHHSPRSAKSLGGVHAVCMCQVSHAFHDLRVVATVSCCPSVLHPTCGTASECGVTCREHTKTHGPFLHESGSPLV